MEGLPYCPPTSSQDSPAALSSGEGVLRVGSRPDGPGGYAQMPLGEEYCPHGLWVWVRSKCKEPLGKQEQGGGLHREPAPSCP